jgi:hypothetical protein
MNRSTLGSLGFVLASAVVALAPQSTNAQSLTSDDQIRSGCINQGYQVEAPTNWWTNDGVTTFRVSDATTGRILMVLVYPDLATADAETAHLVLGYGLSTWRGNVPLVESTTDDLRRQYAAQLDLANQFGTDGLATAQPVQAQPTYAVDLHFLNVIDGATVNL